MNRVEYQKVTELIDEIINKMKGAIGRDFSQAGKSSLLDEVMRTKVVIDGILKKNVKPDK